MDKHEDAQWKQVPLEWLDLTEEKQGEWTLGVEYLRESGSNKPRVRGYAANEQTQEFYTLEAPAVTNGEARLSDADFFDKVPEEIADLTETLATSIDLGVMIGLGREMEILEAGEPEMDRESPQEEGPFFALPDEGTETEPLTAERVEAEIASANVDEEMRELVMDDLQIKAWEDMLEQRDFSASGAVERLIEYQRETARDIALKRERAAEAEEVHVARFQQAELDRRNQKGNEPGAGLGA